jgi:hypothetical protein
VGVGIIKIKNDMEIGRFEDMKANLNNDSGDYLFIAAQK